MAGDAPDALQHIMIPDSVAPEPRLWAPLRQLCFGLVDGGELPPDLGEPAGILRPGVSDARCVAPSPDDGFALTPAEGESRFSARRVSVSGTASLHFRDGESRFRERRATVSR